MVLTDTLHAMFIIFKLLPNKLRLTEMLTNLDVSAYLQPIQHGCFNSINQIRNTEQIEHIAHAMKSSMMGRGGDAQLSFKSLTTQTVQVNL